MQFDRQDFFLITKSFLELPATSQGLHHWMVSRDLWPLPSLWSDCSFPLMSLELLHVMSYTTPSQTSCDLTVSIYLCLFMCDRQDGGVPDTGRERVHSEVWAGWSVGPEGPENTWPAWKLHTATQRQHLWVSLSLLSGNLFLAHQNIKATYVRYRTRYHRDEKTLKYRVQYWYTRKRYR